MALEVVNTGSYISADKNGFLLSRTSHHSIDKKWRPAVDEFLAFARGFFADELHSVYLRGSVATGAAVAGVSDIDFFLIVNRVLEDQEREAVYKQVSEINQKYPFITRFDVGFYTSDEILKKSEKALIKLTSVCLFGQNITDSIDKLRPGKDVAVQIPTLELEINDVINKIKSSYYTNESSRTMCVWIMKRFVRAGFELTSERSQNFTRDLFKCWENFSRFYPEKSKEMYEVLYMAINPTEDTKKILEIIEKLGPWIVAEARKQALL